MGKSNEELLSRKRTNKVMNTDALPYYMTNDKWYKINHDLNSSRGHLLTEEGKKIPKVVESYERTYQDDYLLYDGDLSDDAADNKTATAHDVSSVELRRINKLDNVNPDAIGH